MSTEKLAQGLASLGRNGDSMLMHVTPNEVAGLQAIAEANGTSLTVNPHTGMPEAFSLGGVFEALAPMAAGAVLGGPLGMGALGAGLLTGAATTLLTGDLTKGVMAGLGAGSGANIGQSLSQYADAVQSGAQSTLEGTQAMSNAANYTGQGAGAGDAFANLGGAFPSNPSAVDITAGAGNLAQAAPTATSELAANQASGLMAGAGKALADPSAYMNYLGGPGKALSMYGLPLAGAALGGLEESDIYGEPLTNPNDVYDPYARLNLAGASSKGGSGLRLLAGGGPISFASGAMVGGGTGAMQGAGSFAVDTPQPQQAQTMSSVGMGSLGRFGGPSDTSGMSNYANTQQASTLPPVQLGLFATQAQINAAKQKQLDDQAKMSRSGLGGKGYNPQRQYDNSIFNRMRANSIPQAQQNPEAVRLGTLNLSRLPASRLAAGGLAELSAQTQGVQPQQQQPAVYQQQSGPHPSTITTGGNMGLFTNSDDTTQQISRDGFGLTNQPAIMQQGYAKGGELEEGAFIIPADVVSHLGNGSTDAGLAILSKRYGAKPIRGPGDGMSDSIPTSIEGRQEARVADGEAYIPKAVVMREGGAAKFHKMMNRVRKERTGSAKQGKQINPNKLV